jgi:uridine kinase
MSRSKNDDFKPLAVVQEKNERVSNQVLASEIRAIAEGIRTLLDGGLTEDAIVVLVTNAIPERHHTSKNTVRVVLFEGLMQLEKKYLRRAG